MSGRVHPKNNNTRGPSNENMRDNGKIITATVSDVPSSSTGVSTY